MPMIDFSRSKNQWSMTSRMLLDLKAGSVHAMTHPRLLVRTDTQCLPPVMVIEVPGLTHLKILKKWNRSFRTHLTGRQSRTTTTLHSPSSCVHKVPSPYMITQCTRVIRTILLLAMWTSKLANASSKTLVAYKNSEKMRKTLSTTASKRKEGSKNSKTNIKGKIRRETKTT